MVGIIKLYNTVLDRAVVGTSGYDDTIIEKINEVQPQLVEALMPHYEKNQAVKDMLAPFVKPMTKDTVITTGLLAKETDYVHFGSVESAGGQTAYPINNNEVAIINTSPIRQPNLSNGNIFYFQKNNEIYFLPSVTVIQVKYTYIRKPALCALTLTPASSSEIDYVVPSAPTDLEWPAEAFNLLLYMTLEKLGMEMKEPIIIEMSNLGIAREMINVEPQ